MHDHDLQEEQELPRPLGMTLLSGLYLFLFMLTVSSYGQPLPFFGEIHQGRIAGVLIFLDSLLCLYLCIGLMKRQRLTWYLLLGYNTFEAANTLTNLLRIPTAQLENIVGEKVDAAGLFASNITVISVILLLSLYIFRSRTYFNNHSRYLF